jgi:hypothetical protein
VNLPSFEDFDTETTQDVRHAWCAACDDVVVANDAGCTQCEANDLELTLVPEGIPADSPRSIECSACGADVGAFCHEGENEGEGWNHADRVAEVEERADREADRDGILRGKRKAERVRNAIRGRR